MKTYGRPHNGLLVEIILPRAYDSESPEWQEGDPARVGLEIPISERFTPEFVSTLVDITDLDPMPVEGWTFDGNVFAAPVPYQPTPDEILEANQATQANLLAQASQAMAPILVSLQLGDATDAETLNAKAWQAYYRALKLVDVSSASPEWPEPPADE